MQITEISVTTATVTPDLGAVYIRIDPITFQLQSNTVQLTPDENKPCRQNTQEY